MPLDTIGIFLIHNYARVSAAVVWKIVQEDLPLLKTETQGLLEE